MLESYTTDPCAAQSAQRAVRAYLAEVGMRLDDHRPELEAVQSVLKETGDGDGDV